jgi:phosphatidylinositol glycan class O
MELLDEDTVMFAFGDHGMSPTGDHGGETDLETNAALLVYSPRPLFNPLEVSAGVYLARQLIDFEVCGWHN